LEKLARLRRSASGTTASEPQRGSQFQREIADLERRIARQHRTAKKKLIARIGNDRARLERLCSELKAAFPLGGASSWGCSAAGLCSLIGDLAHALPEISNRALHEYRKRIKTVRYLAEISTAPDAQCKELLSTLRKMQIALGEWHDWQILAATAGRKHSTELAELLGTLEKKSLQKALRLCQRSMTQLLKERPASESPLNEKRLPPHRALPVGLVANRARAAS